MEIVNSLELKKRQKEKNEGKENQENFLWKVILDLELG